jgi:hypothetical protein
MLRRVVPGISFLCRSSGRPIIDDISKGALSLARYLVILREKLSVMFAMIFCEHESPAQGIHPRRPMPNRREARAHTRARTAYHIRARWPRRIWTLMALKPRALAVGLWLGPDKEKRPIFFAPLTASFWLSLIPRSVLRRSRDSSPISTNQPSGVNSHGHVFVSQHTTRERKIFNSASYPSSHRRHNWQILHVPLHLPPSSVGDLPD